MKVRDVIAAMDALAPPDLASAWDQSGLKIGSPAAEVTQVLVALTVTREAFAAARESGAQMIVCHHPPIWAPLDALRTDDPETRLWLDIAQAEIACYAAHTNLDVVPGGVNSVLADRLGLINQAPLLPVPEAQQLKLITFVPESHLAEVREAVCAAGAGVIGNYTQCSFSAPGVGTFLPGVGAEPFSGEKGTINEEPERRFETLVPKARLAPVLEALFEAHPYEDVAYDLVQLDNRDATITLGLRGEVAEASTLDAFASHVRAALEISHVRVAGNPDQRIQNVAVLGGSGGGNVRDIPEDIDVFVTGDLGYHDALAALDRGLAVIDAGHHATEKWIVPALAEYLKKTCADLHVTTYNEPETFRFITE